MLVPRKFQDEGDMKSGVIKKDAMGILAMLSQPVAMIADDDDDPVPVQRAMIEEAKELSERRIGVGDLSVIGTVAEAASERRGRIVGIVRVVQVDPGEARSVDLCEPLFRALHDAHPAAFYSTVAGARSGSLGKIEIEVET